MRRIAVLPALIATMLGASAAHASITLIAIGDLTGSSAGAYADLSGLSAPLENGARGNLLGGMGSGLAYAGGNTFIGLPDRGPNANAYNSLVADTVSYIDRFQTLSMALTPNASSVADPFYGKVLPYTLTPTLTATTLLSSPTPLVYGNGSLGTSAAINPVTGAPYTLGSGVPALNAINNTNYFTGRSDNFDSTMNSLNPNNARLDPEGIRVSNDGKSVFISDEYGPYVYQFDRATGQRIHTFTLPANLAVATLGPTTGSEGNPPNTSGRTGNKGMEGLAITPDGKMLVGAMQAPLLQDTNKNIRLVTINIDPTSADYGQTHEYAYKLTNGSGVSEIVAINNHEFLLDERDGSGMADTPNSPSAAGVKQLFKIDITGATDVTAMSGNLSSVAVSKSMYLDVVKMLTNAGIDPKLIPSKIEGVAFGQDVVINGVTEHTLYIANDNDFLTTIPNPLNPAGGNAANPNLFYVFAFSDSDLGMDSAGNQTFALNLTPQQIAAVPEPGTYAMLLAGLGLVGFAARRRTNH